MENIEKQIQSNEVKIKRINKKHFVIFNNGGVISATTPKDWARAHQDKFPSHNFADSNFKNTPNDDTIELFLSQNGFRLIENQDIIIYYQYFSI